MNIPVKLFFTVITMNKLSIRADTPTKFYWQSSFQTSSLPLLLQPHVVISYQQQRSWEWMNQ
jgi:hypothetical protein